MLKKKNIAMVMAAATVATSVAPVFAAVNVENVNEANLIAEVEKLLGTKYTDATETGNGGVVGVAGATNSVYEIVDELGNKITSIADLKKQIEAIKLDGTRTLQLTVTDKGHKTIDGKIVATETTTKRLYDSSVSSVVNVTTGNLVGSDLNGTGVKGEADEFGYITLTFADGSTQEVVAGDYVLDLDKPVDANGNAIDLDNITEEIKAKIAGFEVLETKIPAKQEIPSKVVAKLTYDTTVRTTIEKTADSILTAEGYTKEGAEFINTMRAAIGGTSVVKNGVKYNLQLTNAGTAKVETIKNDKAAVYKLDLVLDVTKAVANAETEEVTITITSDVQKDLATILAAIKGSNDVVDVDGKLNKLVGDTRFETAIEVSKEQYADKNTTVTGKTNANAVILVGEEAIVDGLAAAPLAAEKKAPILLTKKDVVPAETMNEIKRLVEDGKTIYLVGGEHNISKDVEAQLIEEMNANIVRLAGEDRFETSLEIAEELTTSTTEAFVVGGDGLADAMSIASIAANKKAPIIVTAEDKLSRDAKDFLLDSRKDDVTVVGGEARVSTQVLKDIKDIKDIANVERIAGETRNETNAAVINKFASEMRNGKFGSVYVAKDGDNALVDALAAAPLAGVNNGVIVLATDDLTKTQEKAVTAESLVTNPTQTPNVADNASLTQVGGGVGANVIQKLIKALGL